MRQRIMQAFACLFLLLSTSCGFMADTESLLSPPTLSKRQSEVYSALEATLNIGDIAFRYIQQGEFRSPFVFYDMDGDGQLEAIVFYYYPGDPGNTWIKLLGEESSGVWQPYQDFSTPCDQIDFVQFAHLLSPQASCLIVGWQNTGERSSAMAEGKHLGVYSFADGKLMEETPMVSYVEHLLGDFDGGGLEQIIVVQQNRQSGGFQLHLLRPVGRSIAIAHSLPLYDGVEALLQMIAGTLWDGSTAVYLDESLAGARDEASPSGVTATEIVRVGEGGFTLLAGGATPSTPEQESPTWESFASTFRDSALLSRDYNGDNIIEVPAAPSTLAGGLDEGSSDRLRMAPLMQLTPSGLSVRYQTVVNEKERYIFFMPEQWQDWYVSVLREGDDSEWKFYLLHDDTLDITIELMRILAYDGTAADVPTTEGYVDLGSRNTRRFTGYIPLTTNDTPSITAEELKNGFFLLP